MSDDEHWHDRDMGAFREAAEGKRATEKQEESEKQREGSKMVEEDAPALTPDGPSWGQSVDAEIFNNRWKEEQERAAQRQSEIEQEHGDWLSRQWDPSGDKQWDPTQDLDQSRDESDIER